MRALLLSILLLLPGCAALESSNTFAACRAADVATTYIGVHHGFAEVNPLTKALLAHGWLPYIGLSVLAWYVIDRLNEPSVTVAANVVTCGVAAHNAVLLVK